MKFRLASTASRSTRSTRAPKKPLQRVLQIGERRKVVAGGSREGDEEISIAAVGIETGAARRRAEHLQPRHAIAATERGKSITLFMDVGLH